MSIHVHAMVTDRVIGTPVQKAVLQCLADHGDGDGEGSYPSVERMQGETGWSERSVREALAWLKHEDQGLISEQEPPGRRRSVTYKINLKAIEALPLIAYLLRRSGTTRTRGVRHPQGNPAPPAPELSLNNPPTSETPENGVSRAAADECRREAQAAFEEYTDLHPPAQTTERQRRATGEMWWAPLREICEESRWDKHATRALIAETVDRMSRERLTISSPKSIVAVARSVVAEIKRGAFMPGGAKANPQASVAAWLQRTT